MGPIGCSETSVTTSQRWANIPEQWTPRLHRGRSLKSHTANLITRVKYGEAEVELRPCKHHFRSDIGSTRFLSATYVGAFHRDKCCRNLIPANSVRIGSRSCWISGSGFIKRWYLNQMFLNWRDVTWIKFWFVFVRYEGRQSVHVTSYFHLFITVLKLGSW